MLFACYLKTATSSRVAGSCIRQADGTAKFFSTEEKDAHAYALWEDSLPEKGWGQMHISTGKNASSSDQMYCAGFLDAYLSSERIYQAYGLYREQNNAKENWPDGWEDWIQKNINYIEANIKEPKNDYWKGMKLIIDQFNGMVDALKQTKPNDQKEIRPIDFWIFQSAGDFDDLESVIAGNQVKDPELTLKCTGMFQFAENYSDIYFSQNTWSDYRDLHRYLKSYNFSVKEFKAKSISLSTETGHINSIDDYWQADTGLFVLETTMHCFNKTLYGMVKPESVLTWMRVYYAMLTSDNGKEWTDNFIKENSGTYNNEYMILDGKKFKPSEKPTSDLLWMIEQMPAHYIAKDITEDFVKQNWFPSINTPYFDDIFDMANYSAQGSDFWTYYKQPRYLLIKQHQPDIKDYKSFQTFMRWNHYNEEGEANFGEPAQGIEARYDLRPENGTKYGKKNHFGGLDSKTSTITRLMKDLSFDAINSPVYENLPAFNFNDWPEISHTGLPAEWRFPWMEFAPAGVKCNTTKKEDECLDMEGCGFCLYSQECFPLLSKDRPAYGYKCEDGWHVKTVVPSYALPLVVSVSVIVVVFVAVVYISAYLYAKKESEGIAAYDAVK